MKYMIIIVSILFILLPLSTTYGIDRRQLSSGTFQDVKILSTTSTTVGDLTQIKFQITLTNPVTVDSTITIIFPYRFHYDVTNTDYPMIDTSLLACYDQTMAILLCSYSNDALRTLSISNIFNSGNLASGSVVEFSVSGILNPITTGFIAALTLQTLSLTSAIIDQGSLPYSSPTESMLDYASWIADNYEVQISTTYKIQFVAKVPLKQGCLIKLFLPYPDYDINSGDISSIQGHGLLGSVRELQYQLNYNENSISIIDGCQTDKMQGNMAFIFINGIKNPYTIKTTGNLRIEISDSANSAIAQLTSSQNVNFQATQGTISSLSITAQTKQVSSQTSLTFSFTPQHALISMTQLKIEIFDLTFQFSNTLTIPESNILGISSALVTLSTTSNSQIVIIKGFSTVIDFGATALLTLSKITLPGSVSTLGSVQLSTFLQPQGSSQYYLVDTNSFSNLLTTVDGKFQDFNIYPDSYVASAITNYNLYIQTSSAIPQNGKITFQMSSDLSIPILQNLQCHLLTVQLPCTFSNNVLTMTLSSQSIPDNTKVTFSLSGIQNPRSLAPISGFSIVSYDQSGNLIDQLQNNDLSLAMSDTYSILSSQITSISSNTVADTNVAITATIMPASDLISGDKLQLTYPQELSMSTITTCESTLLQQPLTCILDSTSRKIIIPLQFQSGTLLASTPFDITIGGFTNPSNGDQSSSFQATILDSNYYSINNDNNQNPMTVKMQSPFQITSGYQITHDNAIPFYPTKVQITFQNAHMIPNNGYLQVTVPFQIQLSQTDSLVCSSSTSIQPITCSFDASTRIINFPNSVSSDINDGSQIVLQIQGLQNSKSSQSTDSFKVQTFTASGNVIDIISNGLSLKNNCDYPCQTCSSTSPTKCTSCLPQSLSDYFILFNNLCKQNCDEGFYQTSDFIPACNLCNSTCNTCSGDAVTCTSCYGGSALPYLHNNICVATCPSGYFQDDIMRTCSQCSSSCLTCRTSALKCTSCKTGTFLLNNQCPKQCPADYYIESTDQNKCIPCDSNCQTCSSNTTYCETCNSNLKLDLLDRTCKSQCPSFVMADEGDGFCRPCNQNCTTCKFDNSNSCTTCPPELKLLPTNECVASCPQGQIEIKKGLCENCAKGCEVCINKNASFCTSCIEGYFNVDYQSCSLQCPDGYEKNETTRQCIDVRLKCGYGYSISGDGKQCLLTSVQCKHGYRPNKFLSMCIPISTFFVPFPITILLTFLSLMFILITKIKRYNNTNIVSVLIVLWGFGEILIFLLQIVFAVLFEHWSAFGLTSAALILHFCLNYYSVWYFKKRNKKDIAFQHWTIEYPNAKRRILKISQIYNAKSLRLVSSALFDRPYYLASFDDLKNNYYKPLLRFSILNLVVVYVPIIVADVMAFLTVQWSYQLFVECGESFIAIIVLTLLQILDFIKVRKEYQLNYYKINPKNHEMMDNVMGAFDDEIDPQNVKLRKQRSRKRKTILEQINEELEKQMIYRENKTKFDHIILMDEIVDFESSRVQLMPNRLYCSTQGHNGDLEVLTENQSERHTYNGTHESRYDDLEALNESRVMFKEVSDEIKAYKKAMQAQHACTQTNRKFLIQEAKRQLNKRKSSIASSSNRQIKSNSSVDILMKLNIKDYSRYRDVRTYINDIMGEFDVNAEGNFMIVQDKNGQMVDSYERMVNQRGYLIDQEFNIVNFRGERIVYADDVQQDGDIPREIQDIIIMTRQRKQSQISEITQAKAKITENQGSLQSYSNTEGNKGSQISIYFDNKSQTQITEAAQIFESTIQFENAEYKLVSKPQKQKREIKSGTTQRKNNSLHMKESSQGQSKGNLIGRFRQVSPPHSAENNFRKIQSYKNIQIKRRQVEKKHSNQTEFNVVKQRKFNNLLKPQINTSQSSSLHKFAKEKPESSCPVQESTMAIEQPLNYSFDINKSLLNQSSQPYETQQKSTFDVFNTQGLCIFNIVDINPQIKNQRQNHIKVKQNKNNGKHHTHHDNNCCLEEELQNLMKKDQMQFANLIKLRSQINRTTTRSMSDNDHMIVRTPYDKATTNVSSTLQLSGNMMISPSNASQWNYNMTPSIQTRALVAAKNSLIASPSTISHFMENDFEPEEMRPQTKVQQKRQSQRLNFRKTSLKLKALESIYTGISNKNQPVFKNDRI